MKPVKARMRRQLPLRKRKQSFLGGKMRRVSRLLGRFLVVLFFKGVIDFQGEVGLIKKSWVFASFVMRSITRFYWLLLGGGPPAKY